MAYSTAREDRMVSRNEIAAILATHVTYDDSKARKALETLWEVATACFQAAPGSKLQEWQRFLMFWNFLMFCQILLQYGNLQ